MHVPKTILAAVPLGWPVASPERVRSVWSTRDALLGLHEMFQRDRQMYSPFGSKSKCSWQHVLGPAGESHFHEILASSRFVTDRRLSGFLAGNGFDLARKETGAVLSFTCSGPASRRPAAELMGITLPRRHWPGCSRERLTHPTCCGWRERTELFA